TPGRKTNCWRAPASLADCGALSSFRETVMPRHITGALLSPPRPDRDVRHNQTVGVMSDLASAAVSIPHHVKVGGFNFGDSLLQDLLIGRAIRNVRLPPREGTHPTF